MDNQPTQPVMANTPPPKAPSQAANSQAAPNPTTPNPVAPTPTQPNPQSTNQPINQPTPPTGLPPSGDVILEAGKKKRKKGRIAAIIICLLLLLGGGAFAAAYIINNQPNNIIMSALGNFLSAEQIEANGTINLTFENSENIGIDSVNINLDEKAIGVSNTTTAKVDINFTNGTNATAIEFGEVLLNNGTLYIETNGLGDFYDNVFRDIYKTTIMSQATSSYSAAAVSECQTSSDTTNCYTVYDTYTLDPVTKASVESTIDDILDQVGEIIDSIDGQWIEISLNDVLSSDLVGSIPTSTRESITSTYNCTLNVLNALPNYSGELSTLYNQNPFINMTAGNNSFYNISLNATNLANYLNKVPSTKLYSDLANCFNATTTTTSNITAENVSSLVEYLPQVSAKFDGFFSHYLSELKISSQNDAYTLSSDLKFSYPHNLTVNAPANTRPVTDIIKEVYQKIGDITTLYSL